MDLGCNIELIDWDGLVIRFHPESSQLTGHLVQYPRIKGGEHYAMTFAVGYFVSPTDVKNFASSLVPFFYEHRTPMEEGGILPPPSVKLQKVEGDMVIEVLPPA